MKSSLLFEFEVNKNDSTIHVKREFAANVDTVWEAWTHPEILDLWWAPKPYRTKTKSMDFTVNGYWLYAMISPEGEKHWCRADYKTIDIPKSFSCLDAFCDESGQHDTSMPRTHWTNIFSENTGRTTVDITLKYESLSDLEKIIEMGFREGFSMALENLDLYLESYTG